VKFKWHIAGLQVGPRPTITALQTFDGITDSEDERSSVLELVGLNKANNGKMVNCTGTNTIAQRAHSRNNTMSLDVHCRCPLAGHPPPAPQTHRPG
jgi:hypothetical protein